MQTRAAICGTGVLLAIVFLLAGFPFILMTVPVAVLFLGIVADPEETHAAWYGILYAIGTFDVASLADEEKENFARKKHYFWFGEVGMASVLSGAFAIPAGIFLAGRAEITLAFIGAAAIFLPLFVFLPKTIRLAMRTNPDSAIGAFGKNEHLRKVFWTVFAAMAGLVVTRVLDPVTAQAVVRIITGTGV